MGGKGIICAEGELWREQRRFVAGCLRALGMVRVGARRDRLERRIAAGAAALASSLRHHAGAAVDPAPLLLHHVGNVVSSVVFGREWGEDDPTWRWLLHTQEEGTKLIGVAGAINFLPLLRFLPHYRRMIAYIKGGQAESHALFASMADAAMAAQEAAEAEEASAEKGAGPSGEPESEAEAEAHVLGAFVAEQRRRLRGATASAPAALAHFDDEQRHYLLADLFGAGLDTTIVSLRWFLLLMATHPDEQERVREELRAVVGARPPALEDAPALPRLQAALAEAQRLRPVVPVGIPHGVTQEVRLGEWTLPAGTMLLPLLWAVHMDERHFPEPERFRPQRFLADDGRFVRPAAFMPFQAGKRMCVGETMANMLLLLFGGTVLHAFKVSTAPGGPQPDLEGQCGITLAPKPHRLLFEARA
ncbi:Cytochrome P450 306a1 [Gryllus bimaculatus]|nr:Cytochrome P450 306a1 [Gryllus bimaculatus]